MTHVSENQMLPPPAPGLSSFHLARAVLFGDHHGQAENPSRVPARSASSPELLRLQSAGRGMCRHGGCLSVCDLHDGPGPRGGSRHAGPRPGGNLPGLRDGAAQPQAARSMRGLPTQGKSGQSTRTGAEAQTRRAAVTISGIFNPYGIRTYGSENGEGGCQYLPPFENRYMGLFVRLLDFATSSGLRADSRQNGAERVVSWN